VNQVTIDRVENDVLPIRLAGRWEWRNGLASATAVETELGREPAPSAIINNFLCRPRPSPTPPGSARRPP
jgi:hypothetical protein